MHDPERDIDPVADEYAARMGEYHPVAGMDDPSQRAFVPPPLPEKSPDLNDLEYPLALSFVPPPAYRSFMQYGVRRRFDRDESEEYEWPRVPAQSALHVYQAAAAWLAFWSAACPWRDHDIEIRVNMHSTMYPISVFCNSHERTDDRE